CLCFVSRYLTLFPYTTLFRSLFEAFFGPRLLVHVRMVLAGEPPIRPLNFFLRGSPIDPEDFIQIPARHSASPPFHTIASMARRRPSAGGRTAASSRAGV